MCAHIYANGFILLKMLPLAERMRPKCLKDYIGQKHLVGEGAILRQMIESGNLSSFILWGPPGVGKTTLARIIAHELERPFYTLSAVTSGVKEVRDVIDSAKKSNSLMNNGLFQGKAGANPILFIDEIHRFSKSQQDSLLGAVEEGTITLIGATTENPSFEVITPLLSRCAVYVLKPLAKSDLLELMERTLQEDVGNVINHLASLLFLTCSTLCCLSGLSFLFLTHSINILISIYSVSSAPNSIR